MSLEDSNLLLVAGFDAASWCVEDSLSLKGSGKSGCEEAVRCLLRFSQLGVELDPIENSDLIHPIEDERCWLEADAADGDDDHDHGDDGDGDDGVDDEIGGFH